MFTPENEARARLTEVRGALVDLHRTLVESVQVSFEKIHGRVGPGELLRLALHDPLFTWLRPVSTLVAELDDVLADPEVTVDDTVLKSFRDSIDRRLGDDSDRFALSYGVLLQTDPAVGVAHGALKRHLTDRRD